MGPRASGDPSGRGRSKDEPGTARGAGPEEEGPRKRRGQHGRGRGGAWGLGGTEAGPRGGRCERGSPEIEMVGSSICISGVKLFFFFFNLHDSLSSPSTHFIDGETKAQREKVILTLASPDLEEAE